MSESAELVSIESLPNSSSSSSSSVQVSIKDLNKCLSCRLCNGYYRDAHTISECLHTFCKVCLFTEFDKVYKLPYCCPTCHVALGPLPWQKVIYDRTLQDIVDKLFPQFVEEDKRLELELAAIAEKKRASEVLNNTNSSCADATSKRLKRGGEEDGEEGSFLLRALPLWNETIPEEKRLPLLSKPLLKVVADIKVSKLQKFIQKRLATEDMQILPTQIEIWLGNMILQPNESLNGNPQFQSLIQESKDPIIISYKRL